MTPDKIKERVRAQAWRLVPQLETSQLRQLVDGATEALRGPGIDASERLAIHAERSVYREEIERRADAAPPPHSRNITAGGTDAG